MSALDVSVLVDRSSLSLGQLELNDNTNYTIIRDTLGPGEITRKNIMASSPWISGDVVTYSAREHMMSSIGVRVQGTSMAHLMTLTQAVIEAFEQYNYTVAITIGGETTGVWVCDPANIAIGEGGAFQSLHFIQYQQEIRLQVPRKPNPSAGVI